MKALSIRQPWASLIITGKKTIEIRTWRPRRLELPQGIFIHAGKKFDGDILREFGMTQDLPRGVILGEALMTDILKYDTRDKWLEDLDRHKNRPNRFQDGLYGFVLIDQTEYVKPIPWKGRLGFFDIDTTVLRPGNGDSVSNGC